MIESIPADGLRSKLLTLCTTSENAAAWHRLYKDTAAEFDRSGFLEYAVKEGQKFPDFILPSAEGKLISLAGFLEYGPAIVTFFPGSWCPFSRLMLVALTESLLQLEIACVSVLVLIPETNEFPFKIKQYGKIRVEILSDVDCGVGLTAGIIFPAPRRYRTLLEADGVSLPKLHGNASWFLPAPATFIVSPDSYIVWRLVEADFTSRAEPSEIIETLLKLSGR